MAKSIWPWRNLSPSPNTPPPHQLNCKMNSPLPYREFHQNHAQKVMNWPFPELIPGVQAMAKIIWP